MTDVAAPDSAIAAPDDESSWQRLHPATLALAVVALGPKSLNALPAVAALGFTGNWIWIDRKHTSELQSLMRISYAVFCLKKTTYSKNFNEHKLQTLLRQTNITHI